jgi:hypothetical protein
MLNYFSKVPILKASFSAMTHVDYALLTALILLISSVTHVDFTQ